jgi:hypothetical protein
MISVGVMTMSDALQLTDAPDLDLLEYVLVSAPSAAGLDQVAAATAELVHGGVIRLIDVVGLVRPDGEAGVRVVTSDDTPPLAELAALAHRGVWLSRHDVELAAVTLAPGDAALLLLVEDSWAVALSSAARRSGGRVTGGERVGRDRVVAALDEPGRTDLLVRSPLGTARRSDAAPLVDQVAQVRKLAHLVERGLLSLDQYEVQRRRVLEA